MRCSATFRTTALAVSALLLILFTSCSASSPEAKQAAHRQRGLTHFQNGRFHEAALEYKSALQLDPKDAESHYRLGLTYMELGGLANLQYAFWELSKSTELDPTNSDARLKLGYLYLLAKQPMKATEQADEVLESAPQSITGLVLRGQSLVQLQDYDNGIKDLLKAIELDPKNSKIRIDLAHTYVLMKDFAAAEKTLKETFAADPKSIEAQLELGDLKAFTGRLQEAEAEYRKAVASFPDQYAGYTKLAGFYLVHERWADAEATYQQLAARRSKDYQAQILLGGFYVYIGHDEKARAAYQRAVDLDPKSFAAKDRLIDSYIRTDMLDKAESAIKDMIRQDPRGFEARLGGQINEARIRLARGRTEEAVDMLQRAALNAPESADAHYYFGLALQAKNDLAQARRELTEAVRLAPRMYDARTVLAQVHLAEDSPDLAIREVQTAIQLNPLRAQPLLILGDAFLRKHDFAKARAVYETLKRATKAPLGYAHLGSLMDYKLGLLARAEKRDADALVDFERALGEKPDYVEALVQIVRIRLGQGKRFEARDRVAKQVQLLPTNAPLYVLQGQVLAELKDFANAEASLKKAIELDSNQTEAYVHLASLYGAQGNLTEAIREYDSILAKSPKLVNVHVLLALMYEKAGQIEKARTQYEAALAVDPKFWPAANNLAALLTEQGGQRELEVALNYAERARSLSLDPNVADTLGWIYYKRRLYGKAVDLLKEAALKLPDQPTVQYHYGVTLLKTGNRAASKRHLEAALKLSDTFPGADDAKKKLSIL